MNPLVTPQPPSSVAPGESLLVFTDTLRIPPAKTHFVVKDTIVVNAKKKNLSRDVVRVRYICGDFEKYFLKMTEPRFEGSVLARYTLSRWSKDYWIIREAGGIEHAATTLTEVVALMKLQPMGERGRLLTNGKANIFYVRDLNGVLRMVLVIWWAEADSIGWNLCSDAGSGLEGGLWNAGSQVFFRNAT